MNPVRGPLGSGCLFQPHPHPHLLCSPRSGGAGHTDTLRARLDKQEAGSSEGLRPAGARKPPLSFLEGASPEKCPVAPHFSIQPRGRGGTTHKQQRPDGGSEESSSSDPPTPAIPRAKQDTPTFRLLHAAGGRGWWCRRDLCAVREGRKRKRGKKTLFLTLEEGEQSRESPLGPPPFPTPQPQRTRVRERQKTSTGPERGLALLWMLSLHQEGTRVEKRQGGPTARRADLAPCTGLGPCGSRWGFPSPPRRM